MAFQGFSPKIELAKALNKAKVSLSPPIDQAEKERRKQLAQVRDGKRLEENLAQRALVKSKRD